MADKTKTKEVYVKAGSIVGSVNKQVLVEPLSGSLSLTKAESEDTALRSWKIVGSGGFISSEIQERCLGCVVWISFDTEGDVGGCSGGWCAESASSYLVGSSADDNWVGLSVGWDVNKLSNKWWSNTNSDNTVSASNSVEPVISSDLGDSIYSDNFANGSIVEANFIK